MKNYAVENIKRWLNTDIRYMVRWTVLALVTSSIVGGISVLFGHALSAVTSFRISHSWVFYFLPLAGICIVFLYQKFGKDDGGANQVFSTIRCRDDVPIKAAPMIFISAVLTHLTGGSAGREGAVIQLGGSIANQLGKWIHLDEEDRHVIIMCGMSAAFAALFGTPVAAAIFSMEVINVGIMYYGAMVPTAIAALTAAGIAGKLGVHAERFVILDIPQFNMTAAWKIGIIAILCALVSILFCVSLKWIGISYKRLFKNRYICVLAASLLIIIITAILGTQDYMGAGTGLIIKAVEQGQARPLDFLWKILLTALTMKAGFKGGEIVPAFCVGATFGCVMGQLFGLSPSICAACGMVSVFCGVTNCPITSFLIALEMFGFEGVSYYFLAVAISYVTSGYYGLYKDQTIVYSKYKGKYVNHGVRH